MSAKWIELLKEIVPRIKSVAVLFDPTSPGGLGEFGAARSVEALLQVQLQPVDIRDTSKVERTISTLVPGSSGLIALPGGAVVARRHTIIELAAHHRLPAVYPYRYYVTDGGLASYGPDLVDPYRRAAGYVDRILKGENPADLPVSPDQI
jgi:putative ABC transport system substrate-binding protein